MRKLINQLKEYLRINAIVRLFRFVEVKKTEVFGLVSFAVTFALLEGVGLSLLLPILQYVENGQSALQDSGGVYWRIFAKTLELLHMTPTFAVLIILAFVPIVLRNVVFFFNAWYSATIVSRIMLRLRMKVVRVVYDADPEFYTRHPVGELVGVVMGQTGTAGSAVLSIIDLFGICLLMVLYIGVLLLLSVPLTFSALFFAAIVALVNRFVLKWIAANALKNARLSQKLQAKIVERMGQMQLVKLRHTKKQEADNIKKTSEIMRALSIKASKVGASVEVIVDPILMLSVFITLYIGFVVFHNTLAQLGLLLFILNRLNAKVREFNSSLRGISSSASGVKLVQEMLAAAAKSDTIHSGVLEFSHLYKGIELNAVRFEYPDVYNARGKLISKGREVLRGIDAHIEAGSFTALVGRSGAGKSTLAELIPRMRDVSSGTILFDGHNLKEYQVGSLRRGIGYVTQTPMLFNDTVYDNITYGLGYEPTDDQIRLALEQAFATFVYDLPHGLETRLGDRGVRFSGGERQRIAMARVLLQDTDVLVFDEPTSALDSESEGYIQRTLEKLHGKKTLIVIAHRLATVVAADQLLVVDDGCVVERGTHQELMAADGAYAMLFDSQIIGAGTEASE